MLTDPAFARELVQRYGSPLYAYDLEELDQRVAELRRALPERAALLYSLKANPLPAIARALAARGVRAEVSSAGELAVALQAGFAPREVLYTGPGKTHAEISDALEAGVVRFSCESGADYARVVACAAERGRPAEVLFRLNPSEGSGHGLVMSGAASQFGFESEPLAELLRSAGHDGRVRTLGLHVYYGTQIREIEMLAANAARVIGLAGELFAGVPGGARVLDLGGGFPWPFGTPGPAPDLRGLRGAMERAAEAAPPRAELWFESGRFLAASSGTLLSTVVDVKVSRGRRFVILDAGINHLGGMSGMGRIHLPQLTFLPLTDEPRAAAAGTVVGPLCTPLDVLGRGDQIPEVRPGDLVAVPNVGAYAATASLTGFLSRPSAAEVAYRAGTVCDAYRLRTGHEPIPQG